MRHRFVDCGLDDVYLQNGYEIIETGYGPAPVIRAPDRLHAAIAEALLGRRRISGREAKYLQGWLGLDDKALARLMNLTPGRLHDLLNRADRPIPAVNAAPLRQAVHRKLSLGGAVAPTPDGPITIRYDGSEWRPVQP